MALESIFTQPQGTLESFLALADEAMLIPGLVYSMTNSPKIAIALTTTAYLLFDASKAAAGTGTGSNRVYTDGGEPMYGSDGEPLTVE